MNKTPIEWTDFTVNPFRFRNLETGKVGHHCTKISPGCKNCYSSQMQSGPYLSGLTFIEANKPKGEFFLDEAVLQQVLRRKKPGRIFWCDMTDMFLEDYPDEWIDRCFAVMALTPHLTHQVLTKRSKRLREYASNEWLWQRIHEAIKHRMGYDNPSRPAINPCDLPLPNVWLGVSVEDQQRADERIPDLLQTPAAVRFISAEPLLSAVDVTHVNYTKHLRKSLVAFARWSAEKDGRDPEAEAKRAAASVTDEGLPDCEKPRLNALTGEWFDGWDSGDDGQKLGWVIVGGESGPGARPFDTEWARSIVRQCADAGVPCFVKQLGAHVIQGGERRKKKSKKGGDMHEWEHDLRVRQMPEVRA